MKRFLLFIACICTVTVLPAQFGSMTVYPGDANANGLCSHWDLLHIGYSYGKTGPARDSVSLQWTPSFLQNSWVDTVANINAGHQDCDGNGVVDIQDAIAIDLNFGLDTSGLGMLLDSAPALLPFAQTVQMQLLPDTVLAGSTFLVNLVLDSAIVADSALGIAFTIDLDTALVRSAFVDFSTSIFDAPASAITFVRYDSLNGKLYGSIVRINQTQRATSGTIGTIGIVMEDNLKTHTIVGTLNVNLHDVVIIRKHDPNEVLRSLHGSTGIVEVEVKRDDARPVRLSLFPHPNTGTFTVQASGFQLEKVEIWDMHGRLLIQDAFAPRNAWEGRDLNLPAGVYLLRARGQGYVQTLPLHIVD